MAELTDAAIDAAMERGRIKLATTPQAKTARYDRQLGRLTVELTNGCVFLPPRLRQGLEQAADEQLEAVVVLGSGYGLRWEELDADLSLESLMAGRFGSRSYMERRFGPDWRFADAA